jgi:misacylated tRNA(Ala) deacylase
MENPLYLKDCYMKEFEADVVSVSEGKYVILNQTAFYPNSGGQPHDTGTLTRISDNAVFKVVYVGKFCVSHGNERRDVSSSEGTKISGNISHEVENPNESAVLKPGDKVICQLDWDRRYKLMRAHTAAHIISGIMNSETGALITGNQLDTEKSRIDFSVDEFDRNLLKGYEEKCNQAVQSGIYVESDFKPREEVAKEPGMTKLAKGIEHLPSSVKILRILKIGDIDVQADGGTHVRNTKEIGNIEFIDFVNKGKKNRRIYFKLD